MGVNVLTNRELAGLVLLGGFVILDLLSGRRTVVSALGDLLKRLAGPVILVPLIAYLGWIIIAVSIAARLGFWDQSLTKVLVMWALLTGAALFFNLTEAMRHGPKEREEVGQDPLPHLRRAQPWIYRDAPVTPAPSSIDLRLNTSVVTGLHQTVSKLFAETEPSFEQTSTRQPRQAEARGRIRLRSIRCGS